MTWAPRIDRRDDAFYDADKWVPIAKIGSERYHHDWVSGVTTILRPADAI